MVFDFLKPKPVKFEYIGISNLKRKARKFQVGLKETRKRYGEEEKKVKFAFDKGFKIL